MHISLTPTFEARIKSKVDNFSYRNTSEVIRKVLRLMATNQDLIYEIKLQARHEQLQAGVTQLDHDKCQYAGVPILYYYIAA